ncbi:hypothetical protein ES705_13607 [subsurface metagenome]
MDFTKTDLYLSNRTSLNPQIFDAPVFLPHRATVTKLKLQGYRDIATSSLYLCLKRSDPEGTSVSMASVTADWTDGVGSRETTTIEYATIDNELYSYLLYAELFPQGAVSVVKFYRAEIMWK